jgi:hypothetical protein
MPHTNSTNVIDFAAPQHPTSHKGPDPVTPATLAAAQQKISDHLVHALAAAENLFELTYSAVCEGHATEKCSRAAKRLRRTINGTIYIFEKDSAVSHEMLTTTLQKC